MPRPSSFLHLLVAVMASATALPGRGPLIRDSSTCSARGSQACPAGLPSTFCCPSGSTCLALAANTTALCCPPGSTCDKIQPITCDIRQQNPANFTDSPIKTTALDVPLASCGSGVCCPFGYSCVGGVQCQRNADQSQPPRKPTPTATATSTASHLPTQSHSSSSSSSPASTPSMTAKSSPSPSPSPSSSSSTPADPDEETHAADPKTVSIVAGIIGACTVLVLIVVIILFCRRRNRARAASPPPPKPMSQSASPRPPRLKSRNGPNIISDPIVNSSSYRTDFILKPSPRPSSLASNNSRRSINTTPSRSDHVDKKNHHHRLSIPNPFDSPDDVSPSSGSRGIHDDADAIRGHVNVVPRLPPIRGMKVSSARVYPQSTSTCSLSRETTSSDDGNIINVFADRDVVSYHRRLTHGTTFTDLMDEADLGDVHRGNPYVPRDGPR